MCETYASWQCLSSTSTFKFTFAVETQNFFSKLLHTYLILSWDTRYTAKTVFKKIRDQIIKSNVVAKPVYEYFYTYSSSLVCILSKFLISSVCETRHFMYMYVFFQMQFLYFRYLSGLCVIRNTKGSLSLHTHITRLHSQ